VPPDLVREVVSNVEYAWLMVRGAILHVAATDAKTAYKLVEIGRETGHKHSGIIAMNRAGIFVEILGEERLDIPLKRGSLIADIEAAVDLANKTLMLAKLRLYWLAARLEAELFGVGTPTSDEIRRAIRRVAQCLG